jgi:hypothetical protein
MTSISRPRVLHLFNCSKDSGILTEDLDPCHCKPMTTQIPAINSARLAQDCFLPSTISEVLRQRDNLRALLQQELARASPVRPVRSPLLSPKGNYGTSQACQKSYQSRHGANMPLFMPTIKPCRPGVARRARTARKRPRPTRGLPRGARITTRRDAHQDGHDEAATARTSAAMAVNR